MTDIRKETDSLGEVDVAADKLWGTQTQRSLEPPEQSRRNAIPDNEWRNVLCQRHARSHATSALPSNATRRSSAPPKAQTVSPPS